MAAKKPPQNVRLDLNSPEFLTGLFALPAGEKLQVLKTLAKISQLTWAQVYADAGLKWEKISSVRPAPGMQADSLYSLRINQGRRAVAYRHGDFMVLLSIPPDHDAAYGTK